MYSTGTLAKAGGGKGRETKQRIARRGARAWLGARRPGEFREDSAGERAGAAVLIAGAAAEPWRRQLSRGVLAMEYCFCFRRNETIRLALKNVADSLGIEGVIRLQGKVGSW